MAFEEIEKVGPVFTSKVPFDGVRVSNRAGGRGGNSRYISIQIGRGLAKALALLGEQTALSLQFGTGNDAGKIAMAVDASSGKFGARRKKDGGYLTTLNAASAEGLFSLDFPEFSVSDVDVLARQGKCPLAIFAVSEAMLKVEE